MLIKLRGNVENMRKKEYKTTLNINLEKKNENLIDKKITHSFILFSFTTTTIAYLLCIIKILNHNSPPTSIIYIKNITLILSIIFGVILLYKNLRIKREEADSQITPKNNMTDAQTTHSFKGTLKKAILGVFIWICSVIVIILLKNFEIGNFIESFKFVIKNNYAFLNLLLSLILLFILLKDVWKDIYERKKDSFDIKAIIIIVLLIAAQITYYSIFINTRDNIDTDEARLLYDGFLIKNGHTPYIEYRARAPLLIYTIGEMQKYISPSNFEIFRYLLIPILILSSILIYILAHLLFKNKTIAIIAYILYAFSPLIPNALYIKTETLATPLIIIGLILFWIYRDTGKPELLISSGIVIGLSHNIREVSYVYAALVVFMIMLDGLKHKNIKHLTKNVLIFVIPWLFIGLGYELIITIFSSKFAIGSAALSIYKFWITSADTQRLRLAIKYISTYMLFPILFIALFALKLIIAKNKNKLSSFLNIDISDKTKDFYSIFFVSAGLFLLIAAYTYNLFRNSFWGEYWMEFMPFFSIMGAVLISEIFLKLSHGLKKAIKILAIVLLLVFAISLIENHKFVAKNCGYYDIITVKNVGDFMKKNTEPGSMLTGDPIYAFVSERENMNLLSHPFYKVWEAQEILNATKNMKIKYIIEDMYTKEWYKLEPKLKEYVQNNYDEITPSNIQRVKIYKLKESS